MTFTPIHNSFTTDLSAAPNGGEQVFQVIAKSEKFPMMEQDVFFTYAVKDHDKWHVVGWDWSHDNICEARDAIVLAWRHCDLPPQNQAAVALSFAT